MPAVTLSRQTPLGAPPMWSHPVATPYGAASNRAQQVQALMDQGYSRKEANQILNLDVGGGAATGPGWQEIVGGILDVGGQVASTVQQGLADSRTNLGYDTAAQQALAQQQLLDQQRLLLRKQQGGGAGQSNAGTIMLAVGGLAAAGLLVALVVTRPKKSGKGRRK